LLDGVPGVTQKPIPPGSTFVYKWKATQYGTYWYHAHLAGQLEDGLFGPIHITPANGTAMPFDLISNTKQDLHQLALAAANPQIVMLSDWSHFTSEELHDISLAADIDPL
jgi:FtsP/CotA-like multicopper oxidase with cupredoxin domain